jgi:hypothetical protein
MPGSSFAAPLESRSSCVNMSLALLSLERLVRQVYSHSGARSCNVFQTAFRADH